MYATIINKHEIRRFLLYDKFTKRSQQKADPEYLPK